MTEDEKNLFNTFQEDFRLFLLEQFDSFLKKHQIPITEEIKNNLKQKDAFKLFRSFIYNCARHPMGKKKVMMSKELLKSPWYQNVCKRQIKKIKDTFEQGHSINPYLSHTTNYLTFDDSLLNDWGIIHLHIFPEQKKNKLGGLLLFIYEYEDVIFFLNIGPHDFEDKTLLEIIDNNWKGVLPTLTFGTHDKVYNSKEIKSFRKCRFCYSMSINDKTFVGQSHPLAIDKMNMPLLFSRFCENMSKIVLSNKTQFQEKVKLYDKDNTHMDIHICFDKQQKLIYLYDKISSIGFQITNIKDFEILKNMLNKYKIFNY